MTTLDLNDQQLGVCGLLWLNGLRDAISAWPPQERSAAVLAAIDSVRIEFLDLSLGSINREEVRLALITFSVGTMYPQLRAVSELAFERFPQLHL